MILDDRVWHLLGIAPTQDARTIRHAYARQLKAIDPEADPQAFVQLRGAFDAAMGTAGRTESPPRPEPGDAIEAEAPMAPDYPVDRRGQAPAEEDASERHARAILALLHGHQGEQPWLDGPGQEALIAHWRALASDPRMEQIDYYAQIERWARVVIVETSPLSAPILMIAAERFKWIDADTRANADPYLAEIARRYRLLKLLRMASAPRTAWHPAWTELKKPADVMSSYGNVDPRRVFEILAAMRYALPELEGEFDSVRVQAWEASLNDSVGQRHIKPSRWGGCIAAVIFTPLMIGLAVLLMKAMANVVSAGGMR